MIGYTIHVGAKNFSHCNFITQEKPEYIQIEWTQHDIHLSDFYNLKELDLYKKYKNEIVNFLKNEHPEEFI